MSLALAPASPVPINENQRSRVYSYFCTRRTISTEVYPQRRATANAVYPEPPWQAAGGSALVLASAPWAPVTYFRGCLRSSAPSCSTVSSRCLLRLAGSMLIRAVRADEHSIFGPAVPASAVCHSWFIVHSRNVALPGLLGSTSSVLKNWDRHRNTNVFVGSSYTLLGASPIFQRSIGVAFRALTGVRLLNAGPSGPCEEVR